MQTILWALLEQLRHFVFIANLSTNGAPRSFVILNNTPSANGQRALFSNVYLPIFEGLLSTKIAICKGDFKRFALKALFRKVKELFPGFDWLENNLNRLLVLFSFYNAQHGDMAHFFEGPFFQVQISNFFGGGRGCIFFICLQRHLSFGDILGPLLKNKPNKVSKGLKTMLWKSFSYIFCPFYQFLCWLFTIFFAGRTRTKDKYRVVYSDHQRLELEKEFHYSRYITIRRKAELANAVGLSERQVRHSRIALVLSLICSAETSCCFCLLFSSRKCANASTWVRKPTPNNPVDY